MNADEFVEKLIAINKKGNDATLEHKEKFPYHKLERKRIKSGYHLPATQKDCPICKKIFDSYKELMDFEREHFGMDNIPVDALISAIRITQGTLKLMGYTDGTNKDTS